MLEKDILEELKQKLKGVPLFENIEFEWLELVQGLRPIGGHSSVRIDGIMSIIVQKRCLKFATEIRSKWSNTHLPIIKSILDDYLDDWPPLLWVCPYIPHKARATLRELKANYCDLHDNTYLAHDGLLVFTDTENRPKQEQNGAAFFKNGLKVVLVLLAHGATEIYTARSLSLQSGVSVGMVSYVLKELKAEGYLLEGAGALAVRNEGELLDRFAQNYVLRLQPSLFRGRFKRIGPIPFDLLKEDRNILVSGEAGADILTGNLFPTVVVLYTNLEMRNLAQDYRMIPDPDGDIEIYSKFWKEDQLIDRSKKLIQYILTYSDLLATGDARNLEVARQVKEKYLEKIDPMNNAPYA